MWKTFLVVLGLCATCYADIAVVFNPSPLPALIDTNGLGGGTPTVVDTNALRATSIICTNISYAGLTNALAQVPSGGELYLPAGNYVCTSNTISIPNSNITIRGAGWSTVLDAFNGQTNHFIRLNGYGETCIRDLQIRCSKTGGTSYDTIHGDSTAETNIVLQNVWLNGSDNIGIYETAAANGWQIRDCKIDNCDSYAMASFGDVVMQSCDLSGNDLGVSLAGAGTIIKDNVFRATSGGTTINGAADRQVYEGNAIYEGATAIGWSGANCVVANNTIYHCTQNAIACAATYSTISGNVVERSNNNKDDINLSGASYCTVVGNTIWSAVGFSENGIRLTTSHHCLIEGNTTKSHDTAGITEDADCYNNRITGNNCSGETTPYVLSGTNRIGVSCFSQTDYAPTNAAGSNAYWTGIMQEGGWLTKIAATTARGTAVVDVVRRYMTNDPQNYATIYTNLTVPPGYTQVIFNSAVPTNYMVGVVMTNINGCTDFQPFLYYVLP